MTKSNKQNGKDKTDFFFQLKNLFITIINYWWDEETNIFSNYKDAIAGIVPLIVIPCLSVLFTIHTEIFTFWDYTFPLISISVAGMYDSFGRYEYQSVKNPKLVFRTVLNILVMLMSSYCASPFIKLSGRCVGEQRWIAYIAPFLLLLSGIFLINETFCRIYNGVLISRWNSEMER